MADVLTPLLDAAGDGYYRAGRRARTDSAWRVALLATLAAATVLGGYAAVHM